MFANDSMSQTAPADAIAFEAAEARSTFLRKTYTHLAGAIGAFVVLSALLMQLGLGQKMVASGLLSGWSWLIVLGAFMFVSHVADRWAHSAASLQKQYMGLGLYVVAQALIFTPLLFVATAYFPEDSILTNAAILTMGAFIAITVIVFMTGADFSFLGGVLKMAGFVAIGVIVCSMIFGFSLGLLFSGLMAAFAAASCLYSTSNVMHHYRNTQYVAASLSLFAGIALMFWYIIQILMSFAGDD